MFFAVLALMHTRTRDWKGRGERGEGTSHPPPLKRNWKLLFFVVVVDVDVAAFDSLSVSTR